MASPVIADIIRYPYPQRFQFWLCSKKLIEDELIHIGEEAPTLDPFPSPCLNDR